MLIVSTIDYFAGSLAGNSLPQCLHLIAAVRIGSAQNGQGLVSLRLRLFSKALRMAPPTSSMAAIAVRKYPSVSFGVFGKALERSNPLMAKASKANPYKLFFHDLPLDQ